MLRSLVGSEMCIRDRYNLRKASNLPTTAAHVEVAQANRANATTAARASTGPVTDYPTDRDDSVKLHAEIGVLKNDVRDKAGALQLSESKLEMAESQLGELQARYRALLEETQSRGPSMRERELHQAVSDKEHVCLLYTSDAADEEDSVDLGGRRIIKKKKNTKIT
eukprot:TRINITY_DN64992_c0_g1_i1.p1 TRINITY_DN64992_c0_g1~~TRINITY_DN64992_c0_g1_i1.p1  ORF type:complete len:166 (+),score=50.84 TRINITY_DN64992_c0_g1_i1:139-636(+)